MAKAYNIFKQNTSQLDDYIVLVTVHATAYHETNIDILKHLIQDNKTPGVYVTLNKPYETLKRLMVQNNIDPNMILFIDVVTKIPGQESKKIDNCLFIGSPEKLSDISLAIEQAIQSLDHENKFIFFDSLNTLSIFNNQTVVAKFIHFLTVKMREWKVKGIIISLKKETDDKIINHISQLCDTNIDIDNSKSIKLHTNLNRGEK